MQRKSNVDISNYTIEGVAHQYLLESGGRKDIDICKNYINSATKENYEWDGTYIISYDGVTDLRCYIDVKDEQLSIDFIEGDSIHGAGSTYTLDMESDQLTIESIIQQVKDDKNFVMLCKDSITKNTVATASWKSIITEKIDQLKEETTKEINMIKEEVEEPEMEM